MKVIKLISIVFIVIISQDVFSEYSGSPIFFINPGLKAGIEFGGRNGIILGGELSTGCSAQFLLAGLVLGCQKNIIDKSVLGYFEGELGCIAGGIAFGGDFGSNNYRSSRIRGFAGLFLYLSLKYSPVGNVFEISLVGKEVISPQGICLPIEFHKIFD
jgi:hypothetical protein